MKIETKSKLKITHFLWLSLFMRNNETIAALLMLPSRFQQNAVSNTIHQRIDYDLSMDQNSRFVISSHVYNQGI